MKFDKSDPRDLLLVNKSIPLLRIASTVEVEVSESFEINDHGFVALNTILAVVM